MKKLNARIFFWLTCGLLAVVSLPAQKGAGQLDQLPDQYPKDWGLTPEDIADVILKDQYPTLHNGLQHFYYTQRHQGIEVYNAIIGLHFGPGGDLQYATNRFVARLAEKINAVRPVLTPEQAIRSAAIHLGLDLKYDLSSVAGAGDKTAFYAAPGLAKKPIEVRLVYQPLEEAVRLAWEVQLAPAGTTDDWNFRVDAVDGAILRQDNWVIHCQFPETARSGPALVEHKEPDPTVVFSPPLKMLADEARYRVFPLPVESPLHGARVLVSDPADPMASPFGWHDTNGEPGPEYRITRGNNAHAYQDRQDRDRSADDEPNGGETLTFDFPFNPQDSLIKNLPAATAQLFYTVNMVHDITYHYGFDEAAGNFQQTNYTDAGRGGDAVRAHAQNGANIDNPDQRNNANFSITRDGAPAVIQMYVWELGGGSFLRVDQPEAIAGRYETGTAEFGVQLSESPLRGELALAFDASDRPGKVCDGVVNVDDVKGKIAVIDRGDCFFQRKVLNVEAAGAVACLICNYEDAPVRMAAADNIPNPGIPALVLAYSDCQRIRKLLDQGVRVTLQAPKQDGPGQLDSDFDNGIIVHEYGHGISTRLTGGPATPSCLNNDENLGEGWSDFFALVLTHPARLNGQIARGIGNYVIPLDVNGRGIRRFPYSTNAAINSQSYDDIIATTAPHDVGEVWAATLWDMYWAFVDAYGWDDDLYTGAGGNNIALQLVMDGMKLQPCNPGFIDARDAILEADRINNDGANQCLIWEAFARRGLGWSARQNSVNSRNDGLQAFDVRPECIQELKIAKAVTPNVAAGEMAEIALTVTNHKPETATKVLVSDELAEGLRLVSGSVAGAADHELLDGRLQFRLDSLPAGASQTIRYTLHTDPGNLSYRLFLDDVEDRNRKSWTPAALAGNTGWARARSQAKSGAQSWSVKGTTNANDQALEMTEPLLVTGERPVLRFYHLYLIQPGRDGGFVQISEDGGQRWSDLPAELFFRNAYRGRLDAATLTQPGIQAFWGSSGGFIGSYVDLSPYRDREILIRFRFSSDQESAGSSIVDTGWWVDDIEFFDMYNYDTEACVTSAQGDRACAGAPGWGIVVEPTERTTDVTTLEGLPGSRMRLYPNPAREQTTVALENLPAGEAWLSVRSADGREVLSQNLFLQGKVENWPLSIAGLIPGVYFVQLQTAGGMLTTKLAIL